MNNSYILKKASSASLTYDIPDESCSIDGKSHSSQLNNNSKLLRRLWLPISLVKSKVAVPCSGDTMLPIIFKAAAANGMFNDATRYTKRQLLKAPWKAVYDLWAKYKCIEANNEP